MHPQILSAAAIRRFWGEVKEKQHRKVHHGRFGAWGRCTLRWPVCCEKLGFPVSKIISMLSILRPAEPRDIPSITRIYADAVITGTASYELSAPDEAEMHARFNAIVRQGYPYIVAAETNGEVLGYAYASAFRTRPAYRWLVEDSIYVLESARGRGLGRLLLEELVWRSSELGFRQMAAVIGGASPA